MSRFLIRWVQIDDVDIEQMKSPEEHFFETQFEGCVKVEFLRSGRPLCE